MTDSPNPMQTTDVGTTVLEAQQLGTEVKRAAADIAERRGLHPMKMITPVEAALGDMLGVAAAEIDWDKPAREVFPAAFAFYTSAMRRRCN